MRKKSHLYLIQLNFRYTKKIQISYPEEPTIEIGMNHPKNVSYEFHKTP